MTLAARSIPGVLDVEVITRPGATGAPRLLIETPHGATRREDYERLRAQLSPGLPADLIDYFLVNTDVGSYEYGRRVAERLVAADGSGADGGDGALGSVVLLRCLLPRTFVDVNRAIDSSREESGLTAALGEYIREPADAERLLSLYRTYHESAERLYASVCGDGGWALAAHTYAPKSISIESFDEGIGRALRAAYEPEAYARWPERPEVDVIADDPEGRSLTDESLVAHLRDRLAAADIHAERNATYSLHPASMGHTYAARYPGRLLCLEVRRDLLVTRFTPFEEMVADPGKVDRVAEPIAGAFRDVMSG